MTPFSPKFFEALEYARDLHVDDRRKGTQIPYLAHLVSVAMLVVEEGGDETEAIGALLHDTAEDHGGQATLDEVARTFGAEVAAIVEACSDTLVADPRAKEPWRKRKEDYLAHLREEQNEGALRVSNADKVHNARAILADYRTVGDELWKRFSTRRAEDQLWYYAELSKILSERRPGRPLARELAETVAELRRSVLLPA